MIYEIKVRKSLDDIIPEEGECPLSLDCCKRNQSCEHYGGPSSGNTIKCLFFNIDKEGKTIKATGKLSVKKGKK